VRVAFDEQIFAIQQYGGISRVFAELAREFLAEPLHGVQLQPVNAPIVNEYILRDQQTSERLVVRPARHWSTTIARSMGRRRHRGPADIVHSTFYLPRMLKDYPQAARVVTVYDMIPEIFPQSRRRLDFLTSKHDYVRRADHVVCISESTRKDLLDIYGDVRAPVSVVHLGVASEFRPDALPIPGFPKHYVLHVGTRSGYKDADTLFRAFGHVAVNHRELQLVLVGGGPITTDERDLLTHLGIATRVTQTTIPDRDMPGAYAHASMCVFPSRYEGFGLPALEAMACGTPALLCRSSSLPEVGGEAAAYFEPGDDQELAKIMLSITEESGRAAKLRELGMNRASQFTWQKTASAMAAVYRRTIGVE
jgi:glycosyltransferase involved in cell wall biosynthesis